MNLRVLLILSILIIVYFTARYFYYVGQGTKLIAVSSKFERHYFVGDTTKPKLSYLVMGDSTAVGTGASAKEEGYAFAIAKTLAEQGHFVEVTNIAINGATIKAVIDEQIPKATQMKPVVISLTVGANDATHGTPSGEFKQSMDELLKQLNALEATKVLIANTPNMGDAPAIVLPLKPLMTKRSMQQDEILSEAIKSYPFTVVDLFGQGSLALPNPTSRYARDKFHPNAVGYAIWANVFISKL